MASKRTSEGEEVLRRAYRDRGIDDAHSFAGAIAVGNEIMMEAERTDEKGCGWTGIGNDDDPLRVAPSGSSFRLNIVPHSLSYHSPTHVLHPQTMPGTSCRCKIYIRIKAL